MRGRLPLCLAVLFLAPALAQPDDLQSRAARLRAQHDDAHAGRAPEYRQARAALDACERAWRLPAGVGLQAPCLEAQRLVERCERHHEAWLRALDEFTITALASGRSQPHAALIQSSLPDCPRVLPGSGLVPAEALAGVGAGREARLALPSYPVCESYLRALISAADEAQPTLVEGLALDLVGRCGTEHPDYRRQAEAALIRVGLEPALLDRPRPAASPASAASAP